MNIIKSIHAIDSHTMGEPTRVVVGGIPSVPGKTMQEKKQYLIDNMDHIRTAIMLEPRGHADMFGSIMTSACDPSADFGIIFMDGGGYLNMCGHGSIGAATVAVETGVVEKKEPYTEVTMEAPAGLIKARVKVEKGSAKEVSLINVPSFLYKENLETEIEGYGKIKYDISFGGSFFAIVHASYAGCSIIPEHAEELKKFALLLRDKINETVEIKHPTLDHIRTVDLVEIYDEAMDPRADFRNVVIFGAGQFDRSPCGTGTSAKMAALYKKGKLKLNEEFVYESIAGMIFRGKLLGETKVGEIDAVIPEITGSAFITGFNHFVIDDNDPLKYGFSLK